MFLCIGRYFFFCFTILHVSSIADSRTGTIPTATVQATDEPVYLKGQSYPNPITQTSSSCSVETDDCTGTIDLFLIDLRLANDTSGACTQSFSLTGATGPTLLDCTVNNVFDIHSIFTSDDNYMTIDFTSSVTNEGFFWLGFQCKYRFSFSFFFLGKLHCKTMHRFIKLLNY